MHTVHIGDYTRALHLLFILTLHTSVASFVPIPCSVVKLTDSQNDKRAYAILTPFGIPRPAFHEGESLLPLVLLLPI